MTERAEPEVGAVYARCHDRGEPDDPTYHVDLSPVLVLEVTAFSVLYLILGHDVKRRPRSYVDGCLNGGLRVPFAGSPFYCTVRWVRL